MQSEDLACPHKRKRLIGRGPGPLKKQNHAKPLNLNKGGRRRGGGLVFIINYGRVD
jgi:hypothetical protein